MTVEQLLEAALALLPAEMSGEDDLLAFAVHWVNLTLQEALPYENAIRRAQGEPELARAPRVVSAADALPSYADALVRGAFAYNLASFICKDDLDSYWAESYRNRFLLALIESAPAQPELVVDVYGGQSDGE